MTIVWVWPNKMIENRELHGSTVKRHTYPYEMKKKRVIWYRDKKTNLQLWEKTNNKLFVMLFLTQWNVKVWQKTCTNQSVLSF
jgi:hypothetical protein